MEQALKNVRNVRVASMQMRSELLLAKPVLLASIPLKGWRHAKHVRQAEPLQLGHLDAHPAQQEKALRVHLVLLHAHFVLLENNLVTTKRYATHVGLENSRHKGKPHVPPARLGSMLDVLRQTSVRVVLLEGTSPIQAGSPVRGVGAVLMLSLVVQIAKAAQQVSGALTGVLANAQTVLQADGPRIHIHSMPVMGVPGAGTQAPAPDDALIAQGALTNRDGQDAWVVLQADGNHTMASHGAFIVMSEDTLPAVQPLAPDVQMGNGRGGDGVNATTAGMVTIRMEVRGIVELVQAGSTHLLHIMELPVVPAAQKQDTNGMQEHGGATTVLMADT